MNKETAIERLFATYSKYGVSRELLEKIFADGIEQQGFTPHETYNLLRMSLAHEYGEREYFAVSEVASMLDMTEAEIISEIGKTKAANEAVLHGFRLLLPNGIK